MNFCSGRGPAAPTVEVSSVKGEEQVLSLRLLARDLWELRTVHDLEEESGKENRAAEIRIARIMEFLFGDPTKKLNQNN